MLFVKNHIYFMFQLLLHKDPEVQKAAFQCIMTYKHKYLTPYKYVLVFFACQTVDTRMYPTILVSAIIKVS